MTESASAASKVQSLAAIQSRAISRNRIQWTAYLYILPAFLIIGTFHLFPLFYALFLSFETGNIRNFEFVGLANYVTALTSPDFWNSLVVTVYYVLGTVPITLALGIGIAYLLYQPIRWRGFYRTVYFLPYIISTVASAAIWAWIFNPNIGFLNNLLSKIGIAGLKWLIEPFGIGDLASSALHVPLPSGPSLALVAVMIFSVWQYLGYDVVIFLAGLTNISADLYEAAKIDGANGWQLFRHITLPLLTPTTFFIVTISIIGSFQAFNHIYAMNAASAQSLGGPIGTTTTTTVYLFNQIYQVRDPGYASAVAFLLSIVIFALTLFQFRVVGRRVQYE